MTMTILTRNEPAKNERLNNEAQKSRAKMASNSIGRLIKIITRSIKCLVVKYYIFLQANPITFSTVIKRPAEPITISHIGMYC